LIKILSRWINVPLESKNERIWNFIFCINTLFLSFFSRKIFSIIYFFVHLFLNFLWKFIYNFFVFKNIYSSLFFYFAQYLIDLIDIFKKRTPMKYKGVLSTHQFNLPQSKSHQLWKLNIVFYNFFIYKINIF
jgi:hypothetical protein